MVLLRAALLAFLLAPAIGAAVCTISTPAGLNFGPYDQFATAAATAVTSLTVSGCNKMYVGLSPDSTGPSSRVMNGPNGAVLTFELYQSAPCPAGSLVWGDYLNGVRVNGANQQVLTMCAAIAPQQDVPVGIYVTTMTVTFAP